jgi:hypothetical protein
MAEHFVFNKETGLFSFLIVSDPKKVFSKLLWGAKVVVKYLIEK